MNQPSLVSGTAARTGQSPSSMIDEWELLRADAERYRGGFVLILVTILVDIALLLILDLRIRAADLVQPLAVSGVLFGVAGFYGIRQEARFVACCISLVQLVLFSTAYTLLMYAVTCLNRPLVDENLGAFDSLLGLETHQVVSAAQGFPILHTLLGWSYSTIMLQTAFVIVILGFSGRIESLCTFVLRFMASASVCVATYAWLPAKGPFSLHDIPIRADQQRFLVVFDALREGSMTTVSWVNAEGLITFPSFHTVWAILLIVAVRRIRWVFMLSMILNLSILVSTMTTGWHYFADVVSGVFLTAAVCWSIPFRSE